MAQTIKIKRSTSTAAPSSLQQGELAYSQSSKKLFIGQPGGGTGDILVIGGQYYTDIIDDLVTGSAIAITGDVAGTSTYNSGTGVWTINTQQQDNSVDLGTHTTGNYVATLVGTSGQIATTGASTGEGIGHTISLIDTSVSAGSYGSGTAKLFISTTVVSSFIAISTFTVDAKGRLTAAGTAAANFTVAADSGTADVVTLGETLTFTGDTGITTSVSPNDISIDLDNTAVTPGSYGSSTSIPTFTVDQQGRLTAAGSASITTSLTIQTDDAADNVVALATDTLKLLGGTGITSTNTNDDVTFNLDDTAVTAAQYGSATQLAQFTVDAQGRLTQAAEFTADFVITGDSGSDTVVLQETLHFDGGTGVTTAVSNNQVAFSIGQDVATTADVTFVDVTVNGTLTSDDITSTNISVDGNATITGNLTVIGTTTTVNS